MADSFLSVLKALILGAVFFVWVVRYQNIVEEFKKYNYPNWLRDLTGILKISFVTMLFSPDNLVVVIGAAGIVVLMSAALLTHIKVKNPIHLMLPSLCMILLSTLVMVSSL
jgi:hypothetical protein